MTSMTKYESANMSTISLTKVLTIGHAVTENQVAPHHHGPWWPSQRGQVICTWSEANSGRFIPCKFSLMLNFPNLLVNTKQALTFLLCLTIDDNKFHWEEKNYHWMER